MVKEKRTATTEQQILEAARKIFREKGFEGARMQEIADAAKINKAMLHYYFRSKELLFQRICHCAMASKVGTVVRQVGTVARRWRLLTRE